MNAYAHIDMSTYSDLQATVGAEFVGELIDTYCEETPRLLLELQAALSCGETEAFRRAAHSIKSSSASLGALPLAALARELEGLGREGRMDEAPPRMEPLRTAYLETERALRELQHAT